MCRRASKVHQTIRLPNWSFPARHAWFLGHLILKLESHAAEAQKMESEGDMLGFKTAIGTVSDCCTALYCYISWGTGVVKTLLKKTTLPSNFNGFTTNADGGQDDFYDSDESDVASSWDICKVFLWQRQVTYIILATVELLTPNLTV
ncbi:hypothetical protein EV702DRAFT_529056 [Suillus placidus]|uniref:Uncharacterized protein n=1 Tax=Suillus placidus TaxID=48579 RepID=A0A9P6ZPZ1_9AGAM|nr:hypothetical protein EV702DRAFT_529056 [Suillus placidus]